MEIEQKLQDEELIKSAKFGNMRAFDSLVERYFGLVYAIAYSRLGNRETAEDLSQEVFLRTYLYLPNLKESWKFSGWLVRVTHNLSTDWIRHGKSRSNLCQIVSINEVKVDVPDEKITHPREAMSAQEESNAIYKAIFRLPIKYREIVLLHFAEEMSKEEIASCLNIHPATVGRRIRRALAKMRGSLEPILRESAPSLRAKRNTIIRTISIIAAISSLSAVAKASALSIAGGAAWLSSVSAPAAIVTKGFLIKGFLLIAAGLLITSQLLPKKEVRKVSHKDIRALTFLNQPVTDKKNIFLGVWWREEKNGEKKYYTDVARLNLGSKKVEFSTWKKRIMAFLWLPEMERLVCANDIGTEIEKASELFLLDPKTGKTKELKKWNSMIHIMGKTEGSDTFFVWANRPHGKGINSIGNDIYKFSNDSISGNPINRAPAYCGDIAVSKNGETVFYIEDGFSKALLRGKFSPDPSILIKQDLKSEKIRELVIEQFFERSLYLSPNENLLAYEWNVQPSLATTCLVIYDIEKENKNVEIGVPDYRARFLCWSDNQKFLYVLSNALEKQYAVFLYDLRTRNASKISDQNAMRARLIEGTSQVIVIVDNNYLWLWDLKTGEKTQIFP